MVTDAMRVGSRMWLGEGPSGSLLQPPLLVRGPLCHFVKEVTYSTKPVLALKRNCLYSPLTQDTEAPKLSSQCKMPQEEARHAVSENMRTSKASDASFLEIVFSSRMYRKSNKVVPKKSTKNMTESANGPPLVAFPRCWLGPSSPSMPPRHAGYVLTSVSVTPYRTRAAAETHHTPHPFLDISAAQPEGRPVLLALSKEGGFSGTGSIKEGGCHGRGIWKRSGPMSYHIVSDIRRNWVYWTVISWGMFYRCTHSMVPAQGRLSACSLYLNHLLGMVGVLGSITRPYYFI